MVLTFIVFSYFLFEFTTVSLVSEAEKQKILARNGGEEALYISTKKDNVSKCGRNLVMFICAHTGNMLHVQNCICIWKVIQNDQLCLCCVTFTICLHKHKIEHVICICEVSHEQI